jgi:hypothetical protein
MPQCSDETAEFAGRTYPHRAHSSDANPYNAKDLIGHAQSPHLGPVLQGYNNAVDVIVDGGYISW